MSGLLRPLFRFVHQPLRGSRTHSILVTVSGAIVLMIQTSLQAQTMPSDYLDRQHIYACTYTLDSSIPPSVVPEQAREENDTSSMHLFERDAIVYLVTCEYPDSGGRVWILVVDGLGGYGDYVKKDSA